ncbi:hypothetical protein [Streptomyces griseus]|uniref:hypothetical protein n=1 Tax=Streptomyces griseus TaxID=1911 RepID=UPI00099C4F99|nr:hypothetical protein [Streptomyces griseus]
MSPRREDEEKKRDERAGDEERHDPDERSGRVAEQGRVGRDDLTGRLMTDFERGTGEDDGEDELALRRLLHGAVAGLEPSADALDHLRHAVPARRARKRQALVGAAAAAVLAGTAVPALVHVAGSPGVTAAHPVNAVHGQQAQGGTGSEAAEGDPAATKGPAGTVAPTDGPTPGAGDKNGTASDPSAGRPEKDPTGSGTAERCAAGVLRSAGAYNSGPDATGVVYGGFTVVNGSATGCLVDGDGLVGVSTSGAADPGRVGVVRHSNGDPATGLPDPSAESSSVFLAPGGSYQVKFAWVPSATCPAFQPPVTPIVPPTPTPTPTQPTPTATDTPTPTPTGDGGAVEPTQPTEPTATTNPEGGGGTDTGTGTDSGVVAQLLHAEPAKGSVSVSHTAEPGGPTLTTVIPDACAGTVYRTGLLGS